MTDWNPAEMLGKYPKNLSVDIYKYLITDSNWCKQRSDYGYQNITGKLLKIFCGQPYIDIRLSINSFIPANLSNKVKKNLFSTYYNLIKENTNLHDKLEFEVVFTIWTVAFKKQINKRLSKYGLNKKYIKEFELSLKTITREALLRLNRDINPIKKLIINRKKLFLQMKTL